MGILLNDEEMHALLLVRNVKLPLPVSVFLSVSSKHASSIDLTGSWKAELTSYRQNTHSSGWFIEVCAHLLLTVSIWHSLEM